MISERDYMRRQTETLPPRSTDLVKHTCFRCNTTGVPSIGYEYDYEVVTKTDFKWGMFFLALLLCLVLVGFLLLFFCWETTTYTIPRERKTYRCGYCRVEWNRPSVVTYYDLEQYNRRLEAARESARRITKQSEFIANSGENCCRFIEQSFSYIGKTVCNSCLRFWNYIKTGQPTLEKNTPIQW